jgi:hypothetical protein
MSDELTSNSFVRQRLEAGILKVLFINRLYFLSNSEIATREQETNSTSIPAVQMVCVAHGFACRSNVLLYRSTSDEEND